MDDKEISGENQFEKAIQFHDNYTRIKSPREFLENRLGKDVDPVLKNSYLLLFTPTAKDNDLFFGIGIVSSTFDYKILKEVMSIDDDCETETGYSPLIVFVASIHKAIKKYLSLSTLLSQKLQNQEAHFPGIPVRFQRQRNFSTSRFGGDLINAPIESLKRTSKAIKNKNSNQLQETMSAVASLFFHEKLHHLTDEEKLNTDAIEEITQLGEFLYDPEHNTERNKVFNQSTEFAFNERQMREEEKWSDNYHGPWKRTIIPILIKELINRGIIQLPKDQLEFKQIAHKFPELYAAIPEEDRTKILAKYAIFNKRELSKTGNDIIEELNLDFS